MRYVAFLALLILFRPIYVFAQDPVYSQYTVRDGLPSQTVYCAAQDDEGYMWFGTDAGVTRFNGISFQHFTVNDGLPDNEILRIQKDSKGRMWFLTLKGILSYYHHGKIHNPENDSTIPNERASNGLVSFHEDRNGNLWFGSLGAQVIKINNDGTNKFALTDSTDMSSGKVGWVLLYEAGDNQMLVNHLNKICRIDSKTLKRTNETYFNQLDTIITLENTGVYKGVVVTAKAIYDIEGSNIVREYSIRNYPGLANPARLSVEPDGSLWIFTFKREGYYFKKTIAGYEKPRVYFKDEFISRVFVDSEGNRWFCTIGSGLYKVSPSDQSISAIYVPSKQRRDQVCSVVSDSLAGIIFGTSTGTIYRVHGADTQVVNFVPQVSTVNRVMALGITKSRTLLAATDNGLFKVPILGNQSLGVPELLKHESDVNRTPFKGIVIDSTDRIFASSTYGLLPVAVSSGKWIIKKPLKNTPKQRIYAPYIDDGGGLWFENFERLYCWKDSVLTSYPQLDSLFLNKISCIKGTPDGRLVIGTLGKGLRILRDGRLVSSVTTMNGLAGNMVRKIFISGNAWFVGTNTGTSIIHWDGDRIVEMVSLTTADGLLSDDINDIYADDHSIYLATTEGLCIIDRNFEGYVSEPPAVRLSRVYLNKKPVDVDAPEWLSSSIRIVGFDYIAITYDKPEKVTYQYRLSEEQSWITTSNHHLEFTNLAPGDYMFQIRGRKYNSDWSATMVYGFRIPPPFYATVWFRLLMVILLLLSGFLLIRRHIGKKYKIELAALHEQQALENERRRISADMHDDLGADLTNIVLMSRSAQRIKVDNPGEKVVLGRIEQASRDVISKMNEIIWALNPSNDSLADLVSYLRRASNDFSDLNDFDIQFKAPATLPSVPLSSSFRRNFYLVLKEALRNIYKHANATKVMVELTINSGAMRLVMEVTDNGKGFNPDANSEYGNGLLNMRKRAAELKGDLTIVPESAGGTRITLSVPINI